MHDRIISVRRLADWTTTTDSAQELDIKSMAVSSNALLTVDSAASVVSTL